MAASDKTKVQLRYATLGHNAGDVIEVEAADAKALIENRNAVAVTDEKPSKG